MTDAEIIDGNKLIAEFMGFDITPFENSGGQGFMVFPKGKTTGGCSKYGDVSIAKEYVVSQLNQYHSSWDWLMPVMEKIGKEFDVRITWTARAMQVTYIDRPDVSHDDESIADYGGYEPEILNTWLAAVKFIKWYNVKNKNN